VKYDLISLKYDVKTAWQCPIQIDDIDLARLADINICETNLNSDIDWEYFELISKSYFLLIDCWFDRWSNPFDVAHWVFLENGEQRDATIKWVKSTELWQDIVNGFIRQA
jgi:hypothetical protein